MLKRVLLLSLALSCLCHAPMMAADADADDDADTVKPKAAPTSTKSDATAKAKPSAAKPAAKSKSSKSSGSKVKLSSVGHFFATGSKRAAAVATGFSIGTPIAMVRLIAHADGEQAEAVPFIGESKKGPLNWISRALVIPTSFFSGTVQAPVYSAMNAWKESDDNAFSKESFFLGDLQSRVPE